MDNKDIQNNKEVVEQPLWVALAFSMITKPKHAIWLIVANLIFALYCVPWVKIFPDNTLVASLFKIEGWDWILVLIPILIWYLLCYRWMSQNNAWESE